MKLRLTLLLAATASLFGACTTTAPAPADITRGDYSYTEKYLSWLINDEMSENEITGLSIALVDDQKIIWELGFGYADLENKIPATPETIYRAGSIAKVFTSAATMQLADENKLNIDRPLKMALPDFSIKNRFPQSSPVTPRNIMMHCSGLPSNYLRGMYVRNPEPFESIVENLHDEYMTAPPNYVFSYSNVGIDLLGAAIENVSGESFPEYMDRHFFQPLGMKDSLFAPRVVTKAYDHNKVTEVFSLRDMPAANLLSNVVDLSQFMKMQFDDGAYGNARVLSEATTHQMIRVQNADFPLIFNSYMGLGWMLHGIEVPGGGIVASHGGSLPDSHSMMAILPEHKLGVVVLTNSATAHASVSKIATEALRLMLAAKTGIRPPPAPPTVVSKEREPTQEELVDFDGTFDTMVGLVKVSTNSGAINADAVGQHFQLVPHQDGEFSIKYKLFGLFPVHVSQFDNIHLSLAKIDGRTVVVGHMDNDSLFFGEKLLLKAIPAEFLQYLGKYKIVEQIDGPSPDSIEIKNESGLLVGQVRFAEKPELLLRIAFQPVSDTEAVTAGLGSGRGDELRFITSDNGDELLFSGLHLRKE